MENTIFYLFIFSVNFNYALSLSHSSPLRIRIHSVTNPSFALHNLNVRFQYNISFTFDYSSMLHTTAIV